MATYKVLQDIEAEDKLLGPLTLKQFIFAIITLAIGFVNFKIATTPELSVVRWPFVIVLLFPMVIFGFLAAPISRDQPNDVWLLARIRFLIKPHVRIWNQDGLSQLVTITAPKKLNQIFTNGLDQSEVKSRLTALANTLDSRGWAVKNVDVNLFTQPNYISVQNTTDRLVAASSLPQDAPISDVHAADDMMDASSNPIAQHLDQMVQESTAARRKQLMELVQKPDTKKVKQPAPADYWFMNQPAKEAQSNEEVPSNYTTFRGSSVVAPGASDKNAAVPTADEEALIKKIEAEKKKAPAYNSHMKTLQPLSHQASQPTALNSTPQTDDSMLPLIDPSQAQIIDPPTASNDNTNTATPTSDNTSNPAILKLASNDDLNVATIARQAQRISESDDEVVISLH